MSFINKQTDTSVIRAKLTERGRELLSEGNLTFRHWAIGDSEIDYNFIFNTDEDGSNFNILAPKDKTTNLKYRIPQLQGGSFLNTLTSTNVAPKTVYGQNLMKGTFTKNANNSVAKNANFKVMGTAVNGSLNGLTTLTWAKTNGGTPVIGDIVIIGVPNETQGNATTTISATPMVYLAYKIVQVNNATTLTLDRALPNINTGTATCSVYIIHGDNPINNFYSVFEPTYWDYDNLSFQTNDNRVANNVDVWNYNLVMTENVAGLTNSAVDDINEYKGRFFAGFKNYVAEGLYNDKKVLGIVHFSNNMTSNVYGEGLKPGSFKLHLPTVLWHRSNQPTGAGTTMGLTLVSQIVDGKDYDNLVDGLGNIVGKVLRNDHLAIIEDEELAIALSYKGNRNWTLPTLNVDLVPQFGGGALISDTEDLYCTYLFTNTSGSGFRSGIHCMNYVKVNREGVGKESVRITFPKGQLPFMRTTHTGNGGFVATKAFILMQLVPKGERPKANSWKIHEVTTDFGGLGTDPINPSYIEMIDINIDKSTYTASPIYNISTHLDGYTTANKLGFGDENILFGTVEAIPSAKVYKTSFVLNLMFNQFRVSVNPTYDIDGGKPVFISEVGIYDANEELVLVGKLNKPIKKENSDVILLQLEIDF